MPELKRIDDFLISPQQFLSYHGDFVIIDKDALTQNIQIESHFMLCGKDMEFIKSTKQIEKEIAEINYTGTKIPRERRVEANNGFPAFVVTFYHLILILLKLHKKHKSCPTIPSLALFVYFYFMFNHEALRSAPNNFIICNNEYYDKRFLEGRLIRSYPSLIRDFHFVLLFDWFLRQDNSGSAKYDMYEDLDGTDIICEIQGKEYHLGLCVDSDRAIDRVEQKKARMIAEGKGDKIPDVYFALKLPGNTENTINLYPREVLEKIKNALVNHYYEDGQVMVIA